MSQQSLQLQQQPPPPLQYDGDVSSSGYDSPSVAERRPNGHRNQHQKARWLKSNIFVYLFIDGFMSGRCYFFTSNWIQKTCSVFLLLGPAWHRIRNPRFDTSLRLGTPVSWKMRLVPDLAGMTLMLFLGFFSKDNIYAIKYQEKHFASFPSFPVLFYGKLFQAISIVRTLLWWETWLSFLVL